MTGVAVLERVQRNAALGVRFWDTATQSSAIEGLLVEVYPRANPHARTVARPNPGGVYVAHEVRGLRDFEFDDRDPAQLWSVVAKAYRVEVRDPEGRYLSVAFDADLPARGLFAWAAPWLSPPFSPPLSPPQAVVLPLTSGSPPQFLLDRIPLFSAPSRPVPDPLAVVYAQLRDAASGRDGAWWMLGVSIGGIERGLGLADGNGRVAVMFPYPEPPRPSLASPPQPHNDFTWELELAAFGELPSPPMPAPLIAELAEVLASLAAPRAVLDSGLSPSSPLRLAYRQPVVARSAGSPPDQASFLLVS